MLWGMRDHESTLSDSQRFYYSNYEYYNTYEDLEKTYKDDLSKIRFNVHRKSKGSIILYQTHSSSYADLPHERLILSYQPKRSAHCQHIKDQHYTLDDLLFKFTQIFHEQNYSDSKNQREECKDRVDILILKYMHSFFQEELEPTEEHNYQTFKGILQSLYNIGLQMDQKLDLLDQREHTEGPQLLETWRVFELYWKYVIEIKLKTQIKNKIENFYLFEFCQYFKYFMKQVGKGTMRNILLLAQPETTYWSQIVHPLSIPLSFTLKEHPTPPRVLFINLDGRQTYYNLRVVNNFPESVKYISIFNEPSGANLVDTEIETGCDDFSYADFINMNQAHSQLLLRQIRPKDVDGTPLSYNKNIVLYPLNSLYLRKAYSLAHEGQSMQKRRLPILDSVDLKWLWDQVISRQAEQWTPDITIISYNGLLNIDQEHFKDIIKDLTILSDHRLILFTNMTGLLKPQEPQEQQLKDEQMNSDRYPSDKIELMKEFIGKYMPYNYQNVDQEKYFNNLSSFIKISSGSYSLKNKVKHSPHSRFALGKRLLYLQRLAQLPQYAQILPISKQGVDIDSLFKQFSKRQIEQNRKQSEWWLRKIEEVQRQLIQLDPTEILDEQQEQQSNRRQIAYRIKAIRDQLRVQEELVHGEALDLQGQFAAHLANKKQKLLLQNLQSYHYRRGYTGEEQDRNGRLKCYRFSLYENDGEEILLQKYSQIITDQKRTRIFIINYRISQQKHCILQGQISQRVNNIKMRKVQSRIDQSLQELDLNVEKSELIYLNFSYCFAKDKLYLFWPQEWDIQQQIRRQLLGLEYCPPHINYMVRCFYNPQDRIYLVQKLKWNQSLGIPPIPRRGCVGFDVGSDTRFYIFGGIYDSRLDFYVGSAFINLAVVQEDNFSIQAVAKKKDRNNKNNLLKPKMNYRIQKSVKTSQEGGTILLSGGYGRSFTNFHTFFSYENYSIANELDGLKITRIQTKNHRITRLSHPIPVASIGRYYVGSQGEGQEKFSDEVKDWVLAQGKQQRNGGRETISLLQEEMRVRQFKSDHKRNYLFGWAHTIRERIYVPHCWSPQLQIITNGKQYLVCTALKTQKSNNYNIGNFLIPKQEDLVSLCLDEDRLLLLSNSPVLHSLDNRPNNYILYEGSLANITDLVTRRELPMHQRFQFKGNSQKQQSLRYKTIFTLDDKIYLLGGLNKQPNQRQDYILERNKDKLKKKIRKLDCKEDSLELTSPLVVKYKDGYLLYSVILQEKTIPKGDNAQSIEDYWKLKIQTFTPNQSCTEQTLMCGPLLLYHLDFEKGTIVNRKPQFQQPKIIKIIPYTKFSSSTLREYIEKIYIKLNREDDERFTPYLDILRKMRKERNQNAIALMLEQHHHRGQTFKNMLDMFNCLLEKEHDDLENEELVRDLRNFSSLMNKHFLQTVLQPESTDSPLYRFVIEDRRSSRKVKFIAIGPLLTTRLRFLRIRYKHELSICLNEANEQQLFYNTNILGCEQIAKERSKGASVEWQEQPTVCTIKVNYKT